MQFDNFSPQSFERMVQALSVHVLGPGVILFGAGPDGGRDATFEGSLPYPSAADRWSGYTVVQAKCREMLRHDATDATWLVAQLKHDLKEFTKTSRGLRKPEYYIIATNVTLSPEPRNGGRAKVERVFKQFEKKLGLKGWSIWSADELKAYLEGAADVRTAYTAWLTPSDVLARLVDGLDRPSLKRLLALALARDIRDERDLRLRDAGQETDEKIFLDDVFVDLPVANAPVAERFIDSDDKGSGSEHPGFETDAEPSGAEPLGIVGQLLHRAGDKFDPARYDRSAPGYPNRIVVLGGQGQGKSTLGQFLSQVARARLLHEQTGLALNPQTRDIIDPILSRARSERLPLKGPVRFPIRIDLPRYADALQKAHERDESLTLLAFIASRLARNIDATVSADDLRTWLGTCPSLVVLDGLDEVPPSGNRGPVIEAVNALWDDFHLVQADSFVIVTTRPQGYHHDLDPTYWQHWELANLSMADALKFAGRLAEVRLSDPEKRDAILAELEKASSDPVTGVLMINPLQVTIMFGIALLNGAIPRGRWDLFNEYYKLLRTRESLKQTPTAAIIRDHQQHIDALHQEAGFLLQVIAETAGGATAFLTIDQFKALAERLLREEQFDEAAIHRIAGQLVHIATERLVLLASSTQGRIAFDVRSLQEYMAAAELTSAREATIVDRLRGIALSAHWRHVFRIAASRVFSDGQFKYLRDDVLSICHAADGGNFDDDDARIIHAGGNLALDLAADGVAAGTPKFHKQLVRRALALLDLGPDAFDERLLGQYVTDTADVFREELVNRLQQGTTPAARAAWKTIFALSANHSKSVNQIARDYWPKVSDVALDVAATGLTGRTSDGVNELLAASQWSAGPDNTIRFLHTMARRPIHQRYYLPQWSILPVAFSTLRSVTTNIWHLQSIRVLILGDCNNNLLSTEIFSVDSAADEPKEIDVPTCAENSRVLWLALNAIARFTTAPSAAALADLLQVLAALGRSDLFRNWQLPWVLDTLLRENDEGVSFEQLATEARAGHFGDIEDWRRAERRWNAVGVRPADILTWAGGRYLTDRIADVGAPYVPTILVARESTLDLDQLRAKIDALNEVALPKAASIAYGIVFILGEVRELRRTARNEACRLVVELVRNANRESARGLIEIAVPYDLPYWFDEIFLRVADEFGREKPIRGEVEDSLTAIVKVFNADPSRRGLLSILMLSSWDSRRLADFSGLISRVHDSALEAKPDDEPPVQMAVAMLRTLAGRWTDDEAARWTDDDAARLAHTLTIRAEYISGSSLRAIFSGHFVSTDPRSELLLRHVLLRITEIQPSEAPPLLELLAARSGARPSLVSLGANRQRLALPSLPG